MHNSEYNINYLLHQIREGQDTAFETLIVLYEPLLLSSVRRAVAKQPGLSDEQEEMLQEARCALYRAALSYSLEQADVTFGLYAEICIRNGLTSKFLRRQNKSVCSLESLKGKEEIPSPLEDALETLIQNENVSLLYAFIRRTLSPLEYEVFRMHEEGVSTSEMARKLSRSNKSVENALARAVKKLRQLLTME